MARGSCCRQHLLNNDSAFPNVHRRRASMPCVRYLLRYQNDIKRHLEQKMQHYLQLHFFLQTQLEYTFYFQKMLQELINNQNQVVYFHKLIWNFCVFPCSNILNRRRLERLSDLKIMLGDISYSPRLIAICLSSSQNSLQLIRPYKSPLPAVICRFKHSGTPSSE